MDPLDNTQVNSFLSLKEPFYCICVCFVVADELICLAAVLFVIDDRYAEFPASYSGDYCHTKRPAFQANRYLLPEPENSYTNNRRSGVWSPFRHSVCCAMALQTEAHLH
jgi:hypothetical protein